VVGTKPTDRLTERLEAAIVSLLKRDGRLTYPTLLVELGMLSSSNLDEWRAGRVPYLERVVTGNLTKLARIQKGVRRGARKRGLQRRVEGRERKVRFSKTGNPFIEEEYSAVYSFLGGR
jgi:hypothetical protein